MNRPRIIHWLRSSFSAACLLLWVLLMGLWVRSCWWDDLCIGHLSNTRLLAFGSIRGVLGIETSVWPSLPPPYTNYVAWRVNSQHVTNDGEKWYVDADASKWSFEWSAQAFELAVPHWFGVVIMGALAAVPWLPWSRRFSLRTLLIAVTLLSILLGMVVYLFG
jgi:hypothetical protein